MQLDRKDLEALVKGTPPNYYSFSNPLVKYAGHAYSDEYGKTSWDSLDKLTDKQLYELYTICKNSWD